MEHRRAADPVRGRSHVRGCGPSPSRVSTTPTLGRGVPFEDMAAPGADQVADMATLRAKIREAFDLFDKEGRGTIVEE